MLNKFTSNTQELGPNEGAYESNEHINKIFNSDLEDFNKQKYDSIKTSFTFEIFKEEFLKILPSHLKSGFSALGDDKIRTIYNKFVDKFNKLSARYESKKEEIFNIIKSRYDIGDKTNLIQSKLAKKNLKDLQTIAGTPQTLSAFIEREFSLQKTQEYTSSVSKLTEFAFKNASEFRDTIAENVGEDGLETAMTQLQSILNRINSGSKINIDDIKYLFEVGIFDDEQKKTFLKIYYPTIKISELIELDILKEDGIKNLKKDIIKSYFSKAGKTIQDDDPYLDELVEDSSFDRFEVNIEQFLSDSSNVKKLVENDAFLSKLKDTYDEQLEQMKDRIKAEIKNIETLKARIQAEAGLVNKIDGGLDSFAKFASGNVMRVAYKSGQDNIVQYYEITSVKDDGTFTFKNRSEINGKYDTDPEISETTGTYKDIFDVVKNPNFYNLSFLTGEEMSAKLNSGEVEQVNTNFSNITEADRIKYLNEINAKIAAMEEGKTGEELEKVRNSDEYKKLVEKRDKLANGTIDNGDVKDEVIGCMLASQIDECDPEGKKYGLGVGTSFKIDGGSENDILTISRLDNISKTIYLDDVTGKQYSVPYKNFVEGIRSGGIKRFTNATTFEKLIENLSGDNDTSANWSGFEFKGGCICAKDSEDSTKYEILEQVDDKGEKKVLRLHSSSDGMVTIQEGTKSTSTEKKKVKGEEVDHTVDNYTLKKKEKVTVAFVENYIKQFGLKPATLDKDKSQIKDKDEVAKGEKGKNSFWARFWKQKTLGEIIAGVKRGWNDFKDYMKEGNEEHAAAVSLATWGKFMPQEVRIQLQSRVEDSQKKSMETAIGRIEAVDSKEAITLVYKRITTKNAEQYKKEAAMMYMLKKYGTFYNKNYDNAKMYDQKGSFLFFKSLSGYRGDVTKHELYQKYKKECEEGKIPFTEEGLVIKLIKEQCGEKGYCGIKRRSRLHKDVEKYYGQGVNEEVQDGFGKAKDKTQKKDMLKGGVDELEAGGINNAIGWLKYYIEKKGDTMGNMNKIPFIILMSGLGNSSLSQIASNELSGLFKSGCGLILLQSLENAESINIAIKGLLAIGKRMTVYNSGRYNHLYESLKNLSDNMSNPNITYKEKVIACEKFFDNKQHNGGKTYGELLMKAVYSLADGDESDDAIVSTILELDKDTSPDLKAFADYRNEWLSESDLIKADYLADQTAKAGMSGINSIFIQKTMVQDFSTGGYKSSAVKKMSEEIANEIHAIKKRKYIPESQRKRRLKHYLKNVINGIYNASQNNPEGIKNTFIKKTGFLKTEYGLNIDDFINSSEEPPKLSVIEKYTDQILNGGGASGLGTPAEEVRKTWGNVWDVLNNPPANNQQNPQNGNRNPPQPQP